MTWNDVEPPDLPAASRTNKVIGAVRVALLVLVTAISLGLFLTGRFLRGVLGRIVTFHFGAARYWSRICLWILGIRLDVRGTPISSGALLANHCSWIDILALRANCLIYFVSKAEVAKWPGVGFITRVTGTIFIERKRSEAKRQEQMLRERIAHDQLLCFFPEGTSTDGQRVLPFKSSLFSAFFRDGQGTDIQLQPVSLRYLPAEGADLPREFYGWWGGMGFESHIWDVATRSFGGRVEVVFHDPVRASDFSDRKELSEHLFRVVRDGVLGGVPERRPASTEEEEEGAEIDIEARIA